MKTDVTKQKYLRPAIAVFDMMEDKLLLATSPNVRPAEVVLPQEILP